MISAGMCSWDEPQLLRIAYTRCRGADMSDNIGEHIEHT